MRHFGEDWEMVPEQAGRITTPLAVSCRVCGVRLDPARMIPCPPGEDWSDLCSEHMPQLSCTCRCKACLKARERRGVDTTSEQAKEGMFRMRLHVLVRDRILAEAKSYETGQMCSITESIDVPKGMKRALGIVEDVLLREAIGQKEGEET